MKTVAGQLDATPSKRLYLSIIADYDISKSICELVDNGLDVWVRSKKSKPISVEVTLDETQQLIRVIDNAGGIPKEDLRLIVGPGLSGTSPTDETIGIFGVGTKRAVVALSQDIRIRTRFKKEKTYEVDFDDAWIAGDDWDLPVYQVDDIPPGTTIVELKQLRLHVSAEGIAQLKEHMRATYARFLANQDVQITLNNEKLEPLLFENWAYPPDFEPRRFTGLVPSEDGYKVEVEAIAGLSRESSPAAGEYGVYVYCNDRLIARALRTYDVGFVRGLAGLPHPKVSLTRVLVFLKGDARAMPWNSSKSDINPKHKVFDSLREWLVQTVRDYAALSRIWMGDWPTKVFAYEAGEMKAVKIASFPEARKTFLPPMPKSRPRYAEVITKKNKKAANDRPWTRGLFEGVIAADLISKQHLEQKNRIALLVLDSTLEIAFKEYLVNEAPVASPLTDVQLSQIFSARHKVHAEIKKYITLSSSTWRKIDHYYRLRCKFVHERASVGVPDSDLEIFRSVVESVLNKLYKLKFS